MASIDDLQGLLPCFRGAVRDMQFTELSVLPQKVDPPTVSGFIDTGLDRILSEGAEIAFAVYHDAMVSEVLPGMFRTTVKQLVNDQLATLLGNGDGINGGVTTACPKYEEVGAGGDPYVDFRKFFDSSFSTDGAPSEYGELPSMVRKLVDEELIQLDPATGTPKVNAALVAPLTKVQSGIEGTLAFRPRDGDEYLFNVQQRINIAGFDANVKIKMSDLLVENLDTIGAPLVMLEPVTTEPHHLNNSITEIGRAHV